MPVDYDVDTLRDAKIDNVTCLFEIFLRLSDIRILALIGRNRDSDNVSAPVFGYCLNSFNSIKACTFVKRA